MWKQIFAGVLGSLLTVLILWGIGQIGKVPTIIVPSEAVVAFDLKK